MSFIKDAISIFKKNELALIKKVKESEDVYSFYFNKPPELTWISGQHCFFTISHKKIKKATKPLTLSSSPAEDIVKITTKISGSPSAFKAALLELQEGMKIIMSDPVGSFYLNDNNPALLIAGDIGITPFRSMMIPLKTKGQKAKLLYVNNENSFLFEDELKRANLDTEFLQLQDELYQHIDTFHSTYKENATYYIAGSKTTVHPVVSYLKTKNIPKNNIKKDIFF